MRRGHELPLSGWVEYDYLTPWREFYGHNRHRSKKAKTKYNRRQRRAQKRDYDGTVEDGYDDYRYDEDWD